MINAIVRQLPRCPPTLTALLQRNANFVVVFYVVGHRLHVMSDSLLGR